MKLSVILPCFNGAATIAVQLEALTKQQWRDEWEVVVVDNGSTDDSMTIVERYRDQLPNLQIVNAHMPSESRRGVAHSYTVGLAAATGDAFIFCEADDEVGVGWLSAMGQALEMHDFVAAALEYRCLNPMWLVGEGWQQQSVNVGLSTISPPLFLPYASGCSLGMKRSVYETVGELDQACGAGWDTDFCWRACLAGIELYFVPAAVVHYRLRQKFRDRYCQGRNWAKAHTVLLKKYGQPLGGFKLLKHFIRHIGAALQHLLKLGLHLHSKKRFADWVWGLGWAIGLLQGSWQHLSFRLPNWNKRQILKGV
jgi:glycosyltransferase involved in cell wall biosynthesis